MVFRQPRLISGISGLTLGRSRLMQTIAADLNLGALNLEILKQKDNEQGILGSLFGPRRVLFTSSSEVWRSPLRSLLKLKEDLLLSSQDDAAADEESKGK